MGQTQKKTAQHQVLGFQVNNAFKNKPSYIPVNKKIDRTASEKNCNDC